ncbi:MAG TPA: hypothetical protein VIV64_03535 [Gammaproteobacteria bacterium]|jgi:hypothetical protein
MSQALVQVNVRLADSDGGAEENPLQVAQVIANQPGPISGTFSSAA